MSRGVSIHIDRVALQHNINRVRHYAPGASIMAMVKANGYGHGLVEVAQALKSVDALGVACAEEASILRKQGVVTPLVLMEGFFEEAELPFLLNHQCTLVLHTPWQVKELLSYCHCHRIPPFFLWLKYDSGMHRLGFEEKALRNTYGAFCEAGWRDEQLGLMTHFACGDDPSSIMTQQQHDKFMKATRGWNGPRSACNSAGILGYAQAHGDWVRPGLMLYGASPVKGSTAAQYDLKPVMTVTSQLFACHTVKKGESVGYGARWHSDKDGRIGVVSFGYGDGYPHHARNGTPVLVNGVTVPLVGAVSMDMITVDLSAYPEAKEGDKVVLWGEGLPVEEVSQWADAISYELLCSVRSRC